MDVNEKIIVEWLHLCRHQFTITNISFKVWGSRGGSNYSNIDILAVDNDGLFYDYEIKWRSVFAIGTTDKETVASLIKQMTRRERKNKIREIIGEKSYKKVLITTKVFFGQREKKREEFVYTFKRHGVKVLFFDDIIPELAAKVNIKGRYDSETLQIMRMVKSFL